MSVVIKYRIWKVSVVIKYWTKFNLATKLIVT